MHADDLESQPSQSSDDSTEEDASLLQEVVGVNDGDGRTLVVGRMATLKRRVGRRMTKLERRVGRRMAKLERRVGKVEVDLKGESLLPPDSFSLLVTTPFKSRTHFLAMFVLCVQVLTLSLVLTDALPDGTGEDEDGKWIKEEENRFGFPVDVSRSLRIAEYVAIFIAVFTQDDLVQAFHQVNGGYDQEAFKKSFGDVASKCKWWNQIFFRFAEGALGLFVTFIIIMQADTVIDLVLNFTALEFVANLDNIAFQLFVYGFFGRGVQLEAKKVAEAKCVTGEGGEADHYCSWRLRRAARPVSLGMVYVAFTVGAARIQHDQSTGEYLKYKYPSCKGVVPFLIGNGRCRHWDGAYNNKECGWDGGDCLIAEYPNCHLQYPEWIGNGICNENSVKEKNKHKWLSDPNSEECGWDGGDCVEFNEKYPNCNVQFPSWIGNGTCWNFKEKDWLPSKNVNGGVSSYNSEECGWDGGDCLEFNEKYPNCTANYPKYLGDGKCHNIKEHDGLPSYNSEECGWDGGDCLGFNEKYPNCNAQNPSKIGDNRCDGNSYNSEDCGWDGGDCLEFNEKYPNCNVQNPWKVGNGKCYDIKERDGPISYNTEECGWDGGDCDVPSVIKQLFGS